MSEVIRIESLLAWDEPREVQTKAGPRIVRSASPTQEFWALWRDNKGALKAAGISVSQFRGAWQVSWWQHVHKELSEQRRAAIAESRATSADVVIPAPTGLNYLPYQKAGIKIASERGRVLIGDEMGLGKCHPLDTKVLTPTGWREIGTLRRGDSVIGSNGRATRVTGVYPQGVKDIFRVRFSDHSSVEAGAEHLWTVRYRRGGRHWAELLLTTEQLRTRPRIERLDLKRTRLYLPLLSGPVKFQRGKPLPLPGYTMGQLIANGSLLGSSAVLTTNAADWEEVEARLRAEGVELGSIKRVTPTVVRATLRGLVGKVRLLGLRVASPEKFVPREYLHASPRVREALLQGLLDADGSCRRGSTITYHTTSSQLAADVRELVEGLGGIASIRRYDRRHEAKTIEFQVRIRVPAHVQPFTIGRKHYRPGNHALPVRTVRSVTRVRRAEAVCIAVEAPDRLYVTEHCILTHNTIQAIGVINRHPEIRSVLIVCPAKLRINWERELEKWLVRPHSIGIARGDNLPETDVVIINYDILSRHAAALRARHWDLRVVDEAHRLKNPRAQRTVALLGEPARRDRKTGRLLPAIPAVAADRVLHLTGTPILNRPIELYTLLHDLDPGRWSSWYKFAKRYAAGHSTAYGFDASGASNLDELQEILRSTVLVRRLKKDVLSELPAKRRQVIELPLNGYAELVERERTAYAKFDEGLAAARAEAELAKVSDDEAHYRRAAEKLRYIHRAAFEDLSRVRHELAVAKVPDVIEHVSDALDSGAGKVIIFAHHRDVVDALHNAFPHSVRVYGGESDAATQASVDAFQNDPKVRVFVGSIGAAGVGITLTAASLVVFAELDWVPGNVTQAEDRAHRIGQVNPVLVQHLVVDGSLDARFAKVLVEKQEIADAALDDALVQDELQDVPAIESVTISPREFRRSLSPEQVQAVHEGLRLLSGACDGALQLDGQGFNKFDSPIGKSLAAAASLSQKQALLGYKLVRKYHRQLPAALLEAVGEPTKS